MAKVLEGNDRGCKISKKNMYVEGRPKKWYLDVMESDMKRTGKIEENTGERFDWKLMTNMVADPNSYERWGKRRIIIANVFLT